jgi:16S rRNA (guanine527-N7)-methyltransferase
MSVSIIFDHFPNLTELQKSQLEQLMPLYADWNAKINLISRKDIEALYERHVLHSLGIAKIIEFKPNTEILDVGTGGGFPGIPLAILFPESRFHLVDTIGKKIMVVKEVAQALDLKNVSASHIRAEQVSGQYDFVVSRAVARMKEFYGWIHQKFSPRNFNTLDNGILYLKGGDLTAEMKELPKKYAEYELSKFFTEEFFETKKVIYVPR